MRGFKTIAATALLLAGMLAFGATGAGADTVTCSFEGVTGSITPDDPMRYGVESIVSDLADRDLLDVDTGDYMFSGDADCVVQTANSVSWSVVMQVNSRGTYSNVVCGTGRAAGDRTPGDTTLDAPPSKPDFTHVDYVVDFLAGEGMMVVSDATTDDGRHWSGAGFVHIHPTPGSGVPPNGGAGNCATTDVTEFTAVGAFILV